MNPELREHPRLSATDRWSRDGVTYRDLGADHFSKRNPEQTAKRLIKRLEGLGFAIEARPTTAFVSI